MNFDWLFSWSTFGCVCIVIILYVSPISRVKIGGKEAKPLLTKWKWFVITICTTIATGILLWGAAEPLYHYHQPPSGLTEMEPSSEAARDFAMSTMYMHWTITPYSIYTIAALMFALMYYNLKQPFSVSSLLYPILGRKSYGALGTVINVICLFALVAGMSASLGAGIMTISGGAHTLFGTPISTLSYAIIGFLIVLSFTLSSASGLMKGIRLLSDFNIRLFIILSVFIFVLGPTYDMLSIGWIGLKDFVVNFIPRSINLTNIDKPWLQSWTVFYWANWLAWTPISAIFLGKISRGYTVRQFIQFNLLLPSLFGAIWMMIFSGITLHTESTSAQNHLFEVLQNLGEQSVIFAIFEELPLSQLISALFLFITYLSFVTAADSNTSAMSGICTKKELLSADEAPFIIKMSWGLIIGCVAWVMISYAGIDGLKIISTLGGFPALFLLIGICLGFIRLILNPKQLDC